MYISMQIKEYFGLFVNMLEYFRIFRNLKNL